jgi:pyruvate dehydrogenase E2 component (dihydrolipoamide acetyltransferase)
LAFAENMKKIGNIVKPVNSLNGILEVIPLTGIRKVISERMNESSLTKPCAALTLHVDADKLMEWRNQLKKNNKTVSYNDLLVVVTAKALKEFPIINSKMADKEIQLLRDINIGVAMDTEKGLVVPVIRNADSKGLLEISEEFRMKAERARNGKSSFYDLSEGTFTITNLGMFEIEHFTPIINPPECCILAVGAIIREPVVATDSDKIEIRSRMQLTLVFDHRIVDGAPAARFLQRIKHLIECPMDLMS